MKDLLPDLPRIPRRLQLAQRHPNLHLVESLDRSTLDGDAQDRRQRDLLKDIGHRRGLGNQPVLEVVAALHVALPDLGGDFRRHTQGQFAQVRRDGLLEGLARDFAAQSERDTLDDVACQFAAALDRGLLEGVFPRPLLGPLGLDVLLEGAVVFGQAEDDAARRRPACHGGHLPDTRNEVDGRTGQRRCQRRDGGAQALVDGFPDDVVARRARTLVQDVRVLLAQRLRAPDIGGPSIAPPVAVHRDLAADPHAGDHPQPPRRLPRLVYHAGHAPELLDGVHGAGGDPLADLSDKTPGLPESRPDRRR